MPAGRPTKLTKDMIAKAKKYDYKKEGDVVPTIEGLALHLHINRSTIYEWAVEIEPFGVPDIVGEALKRMRDEWEAKAQLHLEFSNIVSDLLAKQSKLLITNGLKGKFNANITRLILSGKHGYVERQANDLTTNGKDLPVPILGSVSVQKDSDAS